MTNQSNATLTNGRLVSGKVIDKIIPQIHKGPMVRINGIILHQTDSPTAAATINSFKRGGNGAHFLIDKDGTIYQTALVTEKCSHVGPIKSKCYELKTCTPAELKNIKAILYQKGLSYGARVKKLDKHEMTKPLPERYPSNEDSIGIEIVSQCFPKTGYESVTAAQNDALRWLVLTIERVVPLSVCSVPLRHPAVSEKRPTEAASALR